MGFLGGGFFGSGAKSSKSSSSQDSAVTNSTVDASENEGNVNTITPSFKLKFDDVDDGSSVSVVNQMTDFGALDTAGDIAGSAINLVGQSVDRTLEAIAANNSAAIGAVTTSTRESQETARAVAESDTTETIKTLVYGLSAVGIAWALSIAVRKLK